MKRPLAMIYGSACYLFALLVMGGLFLFINNFHLERTLDSAARKPWSVALLINTGLLLLFVLPHSLLARKEFKVLWKRYFPEPMERSSYVLLTSMTLLLLMSFWEPMDTAIWQFESPLATGIIYGMSVFGWLLVACAVALTNHLELFGMRQAWAMFQGKRRTRLPFTDRWLYRYVRHPLYLGWLFAFWAAPQMTAGHLLFAAVLTLYIVIAIPWEERDLVNAYGRRYLDYRERVPKLIPSWSPRLEDETYVIDGDGRYVGPDDASDE